MKFIKVLLVITGLFVLSGCTDEPASEPTITIRFETNGGDAIADLVHEGDPATIELPTASREGYLFEGWFLDSSLSNALKLSEIENETEITVYAKWAKETITISFDVLGSVLRTETIYWGETLTYPSFAYTVNGFYSDAKMTSMVDESTVYTADTTVYVDIELPPLNTGVFDTIYTSNPLTARIEDVVVVETYEDASNTIVILYDGADYFIGVHTAPLLVGDVISFDATLVKDDYMMITAFDNVSVTLQNYPIAKVVEEGSIREIHGELEGRPFFTVVEGFGQVTNNILTLNDVSSGELVDVYNIVGITPNTEGYFSIGVFVLPSFELSNGTNFSMLYDQRTQPFELIDKSASELLNLAQDYMQKRASIKTYEYGDILRFDLGIALNDVIVQLNPTAQSLEYFDEETESLMYTSDVRPLSFNVSLVYDGATNEFDLSIDLTPPSTVSIETLLDERADLFFNATVVALDDNNMILYDGETLLAARLGSGNVTVNEAYLFYVSDDFFPARVSVMTPVVNIDEQTPLTTYPAELMGALDEERTDVYAVRLQGTLTTVVIDGETVLALENEGDVLVFYLVDEALETALITDYLDQDIIMSVIITNHSYIPPLGQDAFIGAISDPNVTIVE